MNYITENLQLTKREIIEFHLFKKNSISLGAYMSGLKKLTAIKGSAYADQRLRAWLVDDDRFQQKNSAFSIVGCLDINNDDYQQQILSQSVEPISMQGDFQFRLLNGNLEQYPIDLSFYSRQILDRFKLQRCEVALHNQKPGQLHGWHFDSMINFYHNHCIDMADLKMDYDKLWGEGEMMPVRLMVPLADWKYGQQLNYGKSSYIDWKCGDILWYDWRYALHHTANSSLYDRPIMRVTALVDRDSSLYQLFGLE
jgi:hypothetical protein